MSADNTHVSGAFGGFYCSKAVVFSFIYSCVSSQSVACMCQGIEKFVQFRRFFLL